MESQTYQDNLQTRIGCNTNQQPKHEVEDKAEDQMQQFHYKHNATRTIHATRGHVDQN